MPMERLNFEYKDINIESRDYAGLPGYDIVHPEKGVLASIYYNDIKLLSTIDEALKERYEKTDSDDN